MNKKIYGLNKNPDTNPIINVSEWTLRILISLIMCTVD